MIQSLSERECEIFQLIAEGRSNKEIAELLSVSPSTYKDFHRAHILQKLDVALVTAEIVLYHGPARRHFLRPHPQSRRQSRLSLRGAGATIRSGRSALWLACRNGQASPLEVS